MTSSASARGWGKGWPQNNSAKMVTVHAGGIRLDVHRDIAELIAWLLDETVAHGYPLNKVRDDWGFANRSIRGSGTPSNHSWGLAVDLNATRNPMQRLLRTDMPAWMVNLWKAHGFDWGGDYGGKKDAMHFEFNGTPADARRITAALPTHQPPPAPTPPPYIPPPPPAPPRELEAIVIIRELHFIAPKPPEVWMFDGLARVPVPSPTHRDAMIRAGIPYEVVTNVIDAKAFIDMSREV